MSAFEKGDRAIWRRQERGGRTTPTTVEIVSVTDAGNYLVSWTLTTKARVTAIAKASTLEPEPDGA